MARPKNREEYRRELAEGFVLALEEKGLSWKKEWKGMGGMAPQNAITKANYRGCNAFWLSLVSAMKGYDDPRWVTMVQIMDKKGVYHPKQKWHLKAGSKASYVEYFYPYDKKERKALTWDQYRDLLRDGRKPEEFLLSSRYTAVFNASLVEGMPELEKKPVIASDVEVDQLIAAITSGMEVPVRHDGGDRAYYSPSEDCIHLPTPESFSSTYAYNATALHEAVHASGSEKRLNRNIKNFFGSEPYAYEELVAEIGSSFLGFHLQTEATESHIENHQAYVQSWISEIQEKPDTLIHAIKDAQAASNYMEWKGGLMTKKEYQKAQGQMFTVPASVIREPEDMKESQIMQEQTVSVLTTDSVISKSDIADSSPKMKERLDSIPDPAPVISEPVIANSNPQMQDQLDSIPVAVPVIPEPVIANSNPHLQGRLDSSRDIAVCETNSVRENPLKNVEIAVEDDYNMIDGIINNGPKESVKEQLKEAEEICAKQPPHKEKDKSRSMEERSL